jgi:redox-sensitive bicupin YhaK (pirin superfamily)
MTDLLIPSRRKDLGGFEVARLLPYARRRMVGPFVFFDHIGPVVFPPGIPRSMDVRPHPHIGLSTITYLFQGEIVHRDSLGIEQPITPGAVNWMTAGRGITHSERFERARAEGGPMHGIQAWVALPEADEEIDPAFQHLPANELPAWQEDGIAARLIVGRVGGASTPVKTHSPLFYLHWQMAAGARGELSTEYSERAAFLVDGDVEVDGERLAPGTMRVFASGRPVTFKALQPSTLMLLGGEPVGERYIEWNFVSASRERIEQAKADWRAGRMKLPDLDDGEFIPLPEEPPPPAEPMS